MLLSAKTKTNKKHRSERDLDEALPEAYDLYHIHSMSKKKKKVLEIKVSLQH